MTLAEIASYVTGKMEQTDDESVAACKLFVQSRYRMIWDSQPWKDTLSLVTLGPGYGNWLVFPPNISRVLKIRLDPSSTLSPIQPVSVFDFNNTLWENSGTPQMFSVFPSVVSGPVLNPNADGAPTVTIFPNNTGADALADVGKVFVFEVEGGDGRTYTEEVTVIGPTDVTPIVSVSPLNIGQFVTRFSKGITSASYLVQMSGDTYSGVVVLPTDTSAPRRARVRILGTAGQTTLSTSGTNTFLAMCKRVNPGLLDDNDTSAIEGIDNALIDFAQADMLERDRQYGKAQAKIASANSQLGVAFDLENRQTANESRIIPAGYDDGWEIDQAISKTTW